VAFQEHPRSWETSRPKGPGFGAVASGPFTPRATYTLLGVMGVVYVLQLLVANFAKGSIQWPHNPAPVPYSWHDFVFVIGTDWVYRPWTLVTSTLSHDPTNPFHIVFNGMFLFFFGPIVERLLGRVRFVAVFFVGGAISGLAQVHAESYFTWHTLWGPSYALGASGALMTLMGLLVILTPHLRIMLYFVPAPLWVAAILYAFLDVAGAIQPGGEPIGHFAHLSGMVLGLVYGTYVKRSLGGRGLRINYL